MLEKLRRLLSPARSETIEAVDPSLAVAALLVEAARSDEHYDETEKRLIAGALAAQFGLDAQGAADLLARGEAAQNEAADLHRFTRVAKTLSADDKLRLVETLWRIVLSDDRRDPHEEALIRRVCGLIYVSDRDSGEARQRVQRTILND